MFCLSLSKWEDGIPLPTVWGCQEDPGEGTQGIRKRAASGNPPSKGALTPSPPAPGHAQLPEPSQGEPGASSQLPPRLGTERRTLVQNRLCRLERRRFQLEEPPLQGHHTEHPCGSLTASVLADSHHRVLSQLTGLLVLGYDALRCRSHHQHLHPSPHL